MEISCYVIQARSSDGVSYYDVTFTFLDGDVRIQCTCPAGTEVGWCRHKGALIYGDKDYLHDPSQTEMFEEISLQIERIGRIKLLEKYANPYMRRPVYKRKMHVSWPESNLLYLLRGEDIDGDAQKAAMRIGAAFEGEAIHYYAYDLEHLQGAAKHETGISAADMVFLIEAFVKADAKSRTAALNILGLGAP